MSVRLNRPSAEQGRRLAEAALASRPTIAIEPGAPPIVEPRSPVTPRRPLSYSALDSYRRCGYRFYVESVLGLSSLANGGRAPDRNRAFGSAVHELLDWSAKHRWIEPKPALAGRVLAAKGLEPEQSLERAQGLLRGWIESPFRNELSGAASRSGSEVPFKIELAGTLVRGTLDLLVQPRAAPPTVVDYKTDRLDGAAPASHADRYSTQRDLYALAVQRATGAERVRVAYVFLERPDEPVVEELDGEAIDAAGERLEAMVTELAAGRFEVTESPDWGLCHDCPARRRLCSAPAEPPGPRRKSPAAPTAK